MVKQAVGVRECSRKKACFAYYLKASNFVLRHQSDLFRKSYIKYLPLLTLVQKILPAGTKVCSQYLLPSFDSRQVNDIMAFLRDVFICSSKTEANSTLSNKLPQIPVPDVTFYKTRFSHSLQLDLRYTKDQLLDKYTDPSHERVQNISEEGEEVFLLTSIQKQLLENAPTAGWDPAPLYSR